MVERQISCKKCAAILAISFEEQYLSVGNLQIYERVRAICGNCYKPFYWNPTEEYLDEIDETPKDIQDVQRKVLLELANSNKGTAKVNKLN
jgi:hypothetical protein